MILAGGAEPRVNTPVSAAEAQSGPLGLLLELIEQRKVDICEVSLAQITDDFLKRISAMEWPDLEESSRFLVIAATLLFIKARVLMPKRKDLESPEEDAEGQDPAELLVDRLRAYKVFRDAARKLRGLELIAQMSYRRGRYEKLGSRWLGNPLEGLVPLDFQDIFERVIRGREDATFNTPEEEVPLAELMNCLLGALSKRRSAEFLKALGHIKDRQALIGSILALLELARLGIVTLSQAGAGEPIWMSLREEAGYGPG